MFTDAGDGFSLIYTKNGLFVSAEGGGSQPLVANRPSASRWEGYNFNPRFGTGYYTISVCLPPPPLSSCPFPSHRAVLRVHLGDFLQHTRCYDPSVSLPYPISLLTVPLFPLPSSYFPPLLYLGTPLTRHLK